MAAINKGDLVALGNGDGPYVALCDSYTKLVRTAEDWDAMMHTGGDYGAAHLFVRLAQPGSADDLTFDLSTRKWTVLQRACATDQPGQ